MRRRFFWGVVGVVLVTLVAAGGTAAVLINRSVQESVRTEFTRQAEATARLVESNLRRPRPARQVEELGAVLQVSAAVGGHDHVEAAVIGEDGGVVTIGTSTVLLDQVPVELADLTRRMQFEAEADGRSVAAYVIPVRVGQSTVVMAIGTDLEIVPWTDVVLRFLWAVALAVLLASILAGWLSRFLDRRLVGLRVASRRMAEGDVSARVEEVGDDEVGEVEVAFNEMAGELQEAQRREREFLVSVSHDLRTPLTTIGGYAEALRDGRITEVDLSRVAAVIGGESARLQRLVEDLMLLSRIEAREFTLRPEKVDLTGHLKGVAEAFRGKAEAAGVELATELDRLPEIEVDPDRVAQVVGNLIENALRYTPSGGRVLLGLSRRQGHAAITVADNGPGIEPGDLPHIFERLYVTQRYRPVRPEGSGLGLSIVKELVGAMGGSTRVTSTPGEGTTVTVVLPTASVPG